MFLLQMEIEHFSPITFYILDLHYITSNEIRKEIETVTNQRKIDKVRTPSFIKDQKRAV